MFQNCYSLTSIDISKNIFSNVTIMNHMFYNCSQLTNLDLSIINTTKATYF